MLLLLLLLFLVPKNESFRQEASSCIRRGALKALSESNFFELFEGDFDNYEQVLAERQQGILATDDAGHEHVHCSLRALREHFQGVHLATYYLDADPKKVFRSRLYVFDGDRMQLHRPCDMRAAHEAVANLPERWPLSSKSIEKTLKTLDWELLSGCDVVWQQEGHHYRGAMPTGSCTVLSQFNNSKSVKVKDELFLDRDALRVDDRGYDADTGRLIYGSVHGEPYTMQRLTNDDTLRWTLGETFRNPDLLKHKLAKLTPPSPPNR